MTPDNRKCKVLVVDDDRVLRTLFERSLKSADYLTASVKTSEEAISWLSENRADLMLLDYLLPDMTGEKLVDALSDKGLLIPFVVLTGRGNERVAVDLMKRGALDYLIKDTSMIELLPQVVAHAFEQLEQRARLAETEEKATRLELLGGIARAVGSELEPAELYKKIAAEIRQAVPCDRFVISSFDPKKKTFISHFEESAIPVEPPLNNEASAGNLIERIFKDKLLQSIPDLLDSPFADNRLARAGFRSTLAFPILQGDRYVAHIRLSSLKAAAFNKGHEDLLSAVGDHIGPAIRNATLHKESTQREERLEISSRIAKAAGSALKPKALFKTIVEEIRRVIPCERCLLGITSGKSGITDVWHIESDIEVIRPVDRGEAVKMWGHNLSETPRLVYHPDINRDSSSPRTRELAEAGFRSVLRVPIVREGEYQAHIGLASTRIDGFTEEQIALLVSVADHLGPVVRNATLYHEATDRAQYLEIVNRISRAAGSTLEQEALFSIIVKEIRRAVPCDRCVIARIDREKNHYIYWHVQSDIEVDSRTLDIEANEWMGEGVYDTCLSLNIQDLSDDRWAVHHRLLRSGVHSMIIVPILQDDRCIAHFALSSREIGAFSKEDEEHLVSISAHVGSAIQNATLHGESEERGRRLAALVDVARSLTRGLDRENVLNSISGAAAEVFGGEAGFRIREGDYLVRMGTTPLARNSMPVERVRIGESISGRVAESGEAIVIADSATDDRTSLAYRKVADPALTGTMMCVPIKLESEVLGTLHIWRSKDHQFSEDDLQLANSLADQTAIAMENASLYSQSERHANRLAALLEVSKSLTRDLNLDDVLNAIVDEGARIFRGEALFRLKIGDELVISARSKGIKDLPFKESYPVGESTGGLTVEGRAPRIIPDIASDENMIPEHKKLMGEWGLGTIMQIPLVHGEELMGFFAICREKGHVFADDEVEIATSLADQASIAIKNARLHEEAIRSLQFFRSVVDDNSDAIVVRDLDYNIIHWNRGAEKIFGYTQEEALGKSAKILYSEEDWEQSRFRDRMSQGDIVQREANRLRKDGSLVPVIVAGSPVMNQQGDVIAVSVVFKDLTEQKRTEAELIERENRFRTIVNNAAVDGIITSDEKGIVESINPSAQEIFGYMPEEIEKKNVSLLMPALFVEGYDGILEEHIRTGVTNLIGNTREVIGRKKDGTEFPMDLTLTEIWARGRRVFTGIIRDLTERKQAEKERREYVDTLLKFNELTQKMNTSLDLDEVLNLILDSTKSLLSVSDVSITSRDGEYLVPKAGIGEYFVNSPYHRYKFGEDGVGKAAQRGSPVFIENIRDYPDWINKEHARRFNIQTCLCVPLKDVEGVVIGALICLTREEKKYSAGEFELINSFANMAAMAIQNAENHSNLRDTLEKLRKSQEMIVRAEKLSSLGTLAAGAAHEILNPAGVIQLRAEIIAEESPEGELVNQSADVIVQSVNRIKRICDDLRRFSRNEVSTKELFNPCNALMSSLDLIKHRLSPANIELDISLGNFQPIVVGDTNQIQQVFLNLVSNAIDAMPNGGKISISSSEVENNGEQYWELRVADTGVGISGTDLTQIFDPFFTTKSPDEGTGLGLSVLHGIVENHGGEVFVESEEGNGAEFIVRLPMAKNPVGL